MTPPEGISDADQTRRDEQRLAELGYKQELHRGWSAFTNFAISFTIISVLAGTFTTFSFAWLHGGPIMASIGWPVICFFVLMVGFSMAELTSRYPTAGGPYWWAHDLGGKGWSWMTGWFNIVGLLGIVASVAYGCAFFLFNLLQLYSVDIFGVNFGDTTHILARDVAALPDHPVPLHGGEHLRRPDPGADEQHLGRLAPARCGGHHRAAGLRAGRPPEHELRLRRAPQRERHARRRHRRPRLLVPGRAGRLPARDVHADRLRRLRAHRRGDPGARRSAPRRGSGARSSSRRSSAGSSCSPSSTRRTT